MAYTDLAKVKALFGDNAPADSVITQAIEDASFIVAAYDLCIMGTTTSGKANKLVDTDAKFKTRDIAIGATVWNDEDAKETTVTAVDDDHTLSLAADIFDDDDKYRVEDQGWRELGERYKAASLIVSQLRGSTAATLEGADRVTLGPATVGFRDGAARSEAALIAGDNIFEMKFRELIGGVVG